MHRTVLSALALAGCAPASLSDSADRSFEDIDAATAARSPYEGTPEGVGLLAFANDCTTTLTVLDVTVALDRRAAENIVYHRDGADRTCGTSDDNKFDTVDELDAVYWVGASAIEDMIAYADAQGYVPTGNDVLGTYDGVTFTVNEADVTLEFVNGGTETELDDGVPLDRRAVDGILAARTIDTVLELSEIYYVGRSAMTAIKTYADTWQAPEVPEEEEPTPCSPVLTATTVDAAVDFTNLLAMSTTGDWPFAEVETHQMTGCEGFYGDSIDEDAMEAALWDASYWAKWAEVPATYKEISAWSTTGGMFSGMLDRSLTAIDERVTDGAWDPNSSAEGAALYAAREDLAAEIEADVVANPSNYVQVSIHFEASECSEDSVATVHLTTGAVMFVHEFPGC